MRQGSRRPLKANGQQKKFKIEGTGKLKTAYQFLIINAMKRCMTSLRRLFLNFGMNCMKGKRNIQ